jgi:hypothetical protein
VRKRRPSGPLRAHQTSANSPETARAAGNSIIARACASGLSKSAGFQPLTTCTSATRKGSTIVSITTATCPLGLARRRSRPRATRRTARAAKKDPNVAPARNTVSFAQMLMENAAVIRKRKRVRRVSR